MNETKIKFIPLEVSTNSAFSLVITDVFKPIVPTKKEYYKALYEFEPRNPDELELDEGDIVMVRSYNNMLLLMVSSLVSFYLIYM